MSTFATAVYFFSGIRYNNGITSGNTKDGGHVKVNCIKCGREIPEGELFCTDCSLAPARKEPVRPVAVRQPRKPVKPAVPRAVPKRPVRKRSVDPGKKRSAGRVITIVLLSLLLALSTGYIVLSHNRLSQERSRLRTREADLQVRENEIDDLEREREAAVQQLEASRETERELRDNIERLNRQLNDSEGSVSQAQYDISSQQQELDRLQAENLELVEAADELDRQIKDLTGRVTSLTSQVTALNISNEALTEKVNFMDRYVVFVNNDGSKLYHSYGCRAFSRQNFWAYSRKLAESSGFSPCPDCQSAGS